MLGDILLKTAAYEELFKQLMKVIQYLHSIILATPSLLAMDFDLFLDSFLMCWEVVRPALSHITAHDYNTCKLFFKSPTGLQVSSHM